MTPRRVRFLLLLQLALLALRLPATAETITIPVPAVTSEQGVPLGDGLMGGLLWGTGNTLTLSLDRGDLWDERLPAEFMSPDWTYATLQRLVRAGDFARVHALFDTPYDADPTPTKLNAGRVTLTFPAGDVIEHSTLDLSAAEADVSLRKSDLAAYVDAVAPLEMLEMVGLQATITIGAPSGSSTLGYPAPRRGSSDDGATHTQWLLQTTKGDLSWAIVTSMRRIGVEFCVAVAIVTNRESSDPVALGTERTRSALARGGYDALYPAHVAWWRTFWNASKVSVPDPAVQRQYDLDAYFYGASSRPDAPPIPLQGVWTTDDGKLPPWKGDYHNDLNTEMTYLAYAGAGLFDQGASFFNYNSALLPTYERFARRFYGVDGAIVPGVESLNGQALGGWAQYSLSPTNSAWIGWMYWRHWRYTMDDRFLRSQAYPFVSQVGIALEGLLKPDASGHLVLPLSSSPEIFDDSPRAWLPPNSNYDLATMRALYTGLVDMANALGRNDDVARWKKTLARLAPQDVQGGALTMARGIPLPESHRHFSNLLSIYPFEQISVDDPAQRALVERSLDDTLGKGTAGWVNYSYSWMAAILAAEDRPDDAVTKLHQFLHDCVNANGFQVQGAAFTLEGNFLAMQAVHEMLLRERNGIVTIFPALPTTWKDVSFERLRAVGALAVSAVRSRGTTVRVAVETPVAQRVRLADPFAAGTRVRWSLPVTHDGGDIVADLRPGRWLVGALDRGEVVRITAPLAGSHHDSIIDIAVKAPYDTTAVVYSIDGARISEETDAYSRATKTPARWMTATDAAWLTPGSHVLAVSAITPTRVRRSSVTFATSRASVPAETPLDGIWQFAAGSDVAAGRWTKVLVPDTFDALDRKWNVYEGIDGVYRRTVNLSTTPRNQRLWIVMDSCGWQCTLRVNGQRIGVTTGGYLPARFDVTNAMRAGPNEVSIEVDNRDATLGDLSGFTSVYWNWGGIFQSLRLERTPDVTVTAVRAVGHADGQLLLYPLGVNATGHAERVAMSVVVRDPLGRTVLVPQRIETTIAPGDANGTTIALRVVHPALWDLDHPNLYTVEATPLGRGAWRTLSETTGFRDVAVCGSNLCLNGRVVRDLQGFNRHADYPGLGRTQPDALADREIKRLHDHGFRIFRPAHYPTTPAELRAADRYGLLVLEEINVTEETERQLEEPDVHAFARGRLRTEIDRDRSHPSIFAWSVGNENATDTAGGAAYVCDVIGYGRTLDRTRLFTQVSSRLAADVSYRCEDFTAENYYADWYSGPAATTLLPMLQSVEHVSGGKPMLITEYGAEAVAGRSGFGRGTEYYQAWLVDQYNRVLFHRPNFVGKLYWLASEFVVSPAWSGGNPDPVPPFHTKALLTYYREPKLAWRVMFSTLRMESVGIIAANGARTLRVRIQNIGGRVVRGTLAGTIHFRLGANESGTYNVPLRPGSFPDGLIHAVAGDGTEALPLRVP